MRAYSSHYVFATDIAHVTSGGVIVSDIVSRSLDTLERSHDHGPRIPNPWIWRFYVVSRPSGSVPRQARGGSSDYVHARADSGVVPGDNDIDFGSGDFIWTSYRDEAS